MRLPVRAWRIPRKDSYFVCRADIVLVDAM